MAHRQGAHSRVLGPYALIYIYRSRLRVDGVAELLAGVGIAVAVALVLASTVAQGSIAGSTSHVVRAVVGRASLQLRAESGAGFDESMLARVEAIPDVKQAAPLFEQPATVLAANGRSATVDVAGIDASLAVLDGLGRTVPLSTLAPGAIGLSSATAHLLRISAGAPVTFKLRGGASPLRVSAVLGKETAGAVSGALVGVMALARLQNLAGLPHRISRILVQPAPGHSQQVRRGLEALAAGELTVAPAAQDVSLLQQALHPSALASQLFAAVGALLGFLLAFNAMLLTAPERRQAIADLRLAGTRRSAIVQIVVFQALCLGVLATLIGIGIGYGLSVWVFHPPTGYLAEAFTLSSGTVVGAGALALAGFCGLTATCLASAVPLLDLRDGRARDAVYRESGLPGNGLDPPAQRALFVLALGVVAVATVLFILAPSLAILAGALLAFATVLTVPLTFAWVLRAAAFVAKRRESLTALPLALESLRATTLRSLALAATGAVALFGSVALGGARDDLLRGIHSFTSSYVADAEVWVSNPGDNQAVQEFAPDAHAAAIARVPGVASVRSFQGAFVQLGSRRVWLIARPPGADAEVLRTQIVGGDAGSANVRLAQGGWVVVSQQIAAEHDTSRGGLLAVQTPSGRHFFRIAATSTNLAWPPGVMFIAAKDFTRYWGSTQPTALGVTLAPGANPVAARAAIAHALGPHSGLEVALAATRASRINHLAGEGLGQLGEISTLLLLAAVGAMAAALASSIWQRRPTLAGLRLLGVKPSRLRRILLLEAMLMLGAGCLTGAAAGVYGQLVLDGYLKRVTGFPLAHLATGARPLEIFAFVLFLALALAAMPGWLASRVPPSLALEDS